MQQLPNQSERPIGTPLRGLAGIILCGTWLICIFRAIVFLADSHRVYAETNSINAWNDFAYGRLILLSDLVCAGIGLSALGLDGRSHKSWIAWMPILASAASGLLMIARRPEEVIVLMPTLAVFYALALCIASALIAFCILMCSNRKVVPAGQ